MKRTITLVVTAAVAVALVVSVPAALASARPHVRSSGTCGAHPWTLRLAHDHGKIEADYKLRNVNAGSNWRIVMRDNGTRFFRGVRTASRERYVEADRYTANRSGTDTIKVRAKSLVTGQVCTASASIA